MKTLIAALLVFGAAFAAQDSPPPGGPVAPVITWNKPAPIRSPAPLTAAQLNATFSAPGVVTYDPPEGTVLDVGTHTLTVTLAPRPEDTYTAAAATVTLEVLPKFWPYDPSEPAYVCHMNPDLKGPVIDSTTGMPRCFMVPVPVSESLTRYLLTQTNGVNPDGTPAYKYPSWWDYIIKWFLNSLVVPMLDQYPPAEVAAAKADAEAALKAVDSAKAAIIGVDPTVLKSDGPPLPVPAIRP